VPRDEELPIIRAFYDFVLWLNPKIANYNGSRFRSVFSSGPTLRRL
jgi:hypothetical protein